MQNILAVEKLPALIIRNHKKLKNYIFVFKLNILGLDIFHILADNPFPEFFWY